jgi:hypothetical protein
MSGQDTLQVLTDDLIKMTDISLESIPQTARRLRDVAKAEYPKRKIIGFKGAPVAPAATAEPSGGS